MGPLSVLVGATEKERSREEMEGEKKRRGEERTFRIHSEQLESCNEGNELGLSFLSRDMDGCRRSFSEKMRERTKRRSDQLLARRVDDDRTRFELTS